MSIHNSYTATTRGVKDVSLSFSPAEEALLLQAKSDWHRSSVTVELFLDLKEEVASLEKQAREIAQGYSANQNHLQIVILLNRAAELRKVIDKYAQRNNPNS